MTENKLLNKPLWRVIDQTTLGANFSAMQSFAIDDTLCTFVGALESPDTCRTWVHEDTITLGIQDTKLPFLEDGIKFLQEKGYHILVRNSGGLAVVLDSGVLNISLLLSEGEKRIGIDDGYDAMWDLIKDMFKDFPVEIEAKEIVGSYCPGSYDLSINGQKFAGISQRRVKKGIAVQIYLCVEGSGSERASLIRDFYSVALQNEETKFVFPEVVPEVMASLSELLGQPLTVRNISERLLKTLLTYGEVQTATLSPEEAALYPYHLERMKNRNEKFL